MTKYSRVCAGYYEYTLGDRMVSIVYMEELKGWVARADWDRYCVTDPLESLKVAKEVAKEMLTSN